MNGEKPFGSLDFKNLEFMIGQSFELCKKKH